MNKVILIGRVTKDIEVRYTQAGKAFATFSIAVDDGWGQNRKSFFFDVVTWDKTAENCGKSLHKGSKVAVSGKLTNRTYENKQGQKVKVHEIVSYEVEFLDGKGQGQPSQEQNGFPPLSQSNMDEEIPF